MLALTLWAGGVLFGLFWWWSAAREEKQGDAARAAGRPVDAAELYAKALERHERRHPQSDTTRALRERLASVQVDAAHACAQRARLAQEFGDYNAARVELREALRLAPSSALRAEIEEDARSWRREPRRDGNRRRGGRDHGRDRDERPRAADERPRAADERPRAANERPRAADDEPREVTRAATVATAAVAATTATPAAPALLPPESIVPQIIDEAYIAASMPRHSEIIDPAVVRAIAVLPPADAEHAQTLGREFGRGYLALVEGRIHDALDGLEAALREHPGESLVLEMYAQALLEAGLPQARAALETLLRHFPERGSSVLTLAELLLDHGDVPAAQLALESAIAANHESGERDERLELRLAEILASQGDTVGAYEVLEDLAAENGEATPAMLNVAASVARAAGDRENEGMYLRQAAQQAHAPSEAHEAYADYLLAEDEDPTRGLLHLATARRRLSENSQILPSDIDRHLQGQVRLLVKSARARMRGGFMPEAMDCIELLETELADATPPDTLTALRVEFAAFQAAPPRTPAAHLPAHVTGSPAEPPPSHTIA